MAHTTGQTDTRTTRSRLLTSARAASVALFCVGTVLAAPASAATQGALGATSTGSVLVTVSVPNRVQITGLSDITLTEVDPNAEAVRSQNNCVWSNTATKGYTITASGSGAGGAFTLAAPSLTAVAYDVKWSATSGATTGTTLAAGAPSANYVSTALIPGCGLGSSSSMTVSIAAAQLQTMSSGSNYTGTLTLLVNPV